MNENEMNTQEPVNEVATATETTTPATATEAPKKRSRLLGFIAAGLVVVLLLLAVVYLLEKEGRSSTNFFAALIEKQEAAAVVATVNGEDIVNGDLNTSIRQFSQSAAAQGVDVASEEAQAEIRRQALEVLINTELLRQQAAIEGIEVTNEEASDRLSQIETEVGGPEALAERMAILGIESDRLQEDIREEIMIERLLDKVFAEANLEATEEEIALVYEQAGGEAAGLPPLEEVSDQVAASIISSKEQQVVDDYLSSLRDGAELDIQLD